MLLDILYFILCLGIIVTIHELGHLIVAKRAGIYCHEFSIGFGPRLFSFKKGETKYSLSLFPLGGFVAMAGEEMSLDNSNIPLNRRYDNKTIFERFSVAIAGVIMNVILAFLLFVIVAGVKGQATNENVIGSISNASNTFECEEVSSFNCLEEGDEILSIGNLVVNNWTDINLKLNDRENFAKRNIEVIYNRDGVENTFYANPRISINSIGIADYSYDYKIENEISDEDYNKPYIGFIGQNSISDGKFEELDLIISIDGVDVSSWSDTAKKFQEVSDRDDNEEIIIEVQRQDEEEIVEVKITPYTTNTLNTAAGVNSVSLIMGISPTFKTDLVGTLTGATNLIASNSMMIVNTISLIMGQNNQVGINDLGGVVSIFNMTSQAANAGVISFIAFVAMLSVNVAILNLLPIPALDGGRIIFLGIEAIRRKKVDPKIENTIHGISMLLLFGFMIYITIVDVIRWAF